MYKMTGAAALHVVLLRVAFAQDAFEVFGWKADAVYTIVDVRLRYDELARGLNGEQWKAREPSVLALSQPSPLSVFNAHNTFSCCDM